MKRRDFLKGSIQLSVLPWLQGHLPFNFNIKNFQVFWLHIEGAPIREAFDFWPDPQGKLRLKKLEAGQHAFKHSRGNIQLPKVWHDFPNSSKLLDHWLSVRGLSIKGPHLKQARSEWFRRSDDTEKSIIQDFNHTFTKLGLPKVNLTASSREVAQIYRPILKNLISSPSSTQPYALESIFNQWHSMANQENFNERTPLSLGLIRSPIANEGLLFESIKQWNESTRVIHEKFYLSLLTALDRFTKQLSKLQRFKHSVILITSDRRKAPVSKNSSPALEPVWQGGNFSMISGSLKGPVTLGDIYKEHPKYAENYPMTWGASPIEYRPTHVHQLIMDLCLAESRLSNYNSPKENPWVAARAFQDLFIKGHAGKVL